MTIHGHNHLLGSVNGVDGIKTGYIRASGFNLITSVHRDGRYIVGVVLGGRSAFERDAHMRALDRGQHQAGLDAALRTGHRRKSNAKERSRNRLRLPSRRRLASEPPTNAPATARTSVGSNDPIRPLLVKTVTYHTVTVRTASMVPMPVLVPVAPPAQPQAEAQTARAYRCIRRSDDCMPVANPPARKR